MVHTALSDMVLDSDPFATSLFRPTPGARMPAMPRNMGCLVILALVAMGRVVKAQKMVKIDMQDDGVVYTRSDDPKDPVMCVRTRS